MLTTGPASDFIKRAAIIAIIRGDYAVPALCEIGDALMAGTVRVIEVTLNTGGALEAIAALRHRFGEQMLIGAGTVRTRAQFDAALAAGSQFTVAPNFDPDTAARACARCVAPARGVYAHGSPNRVHRRLPNGQAVPV